MHIKVDITQEDLSEILRDKVKEKLEVILKPDVIERYFDNTVEKAIRNRVDYYIAHNEYNISREVLKALEPILKDSKEFKEIIKRSLRRKLKELEGSE